jgi:capsule polysaccharide export protein KpsE/RkpR
LLENGILDPYQTPYLQAIKRQTPSEGKHLKVKNKRLSTNKTGGKVVKHLSSYSVILCNRLLAEQQSKTRTNSKNKKAKIRDRWKPAEINDQ